MPASSHGRPAFIPRLHDCIASRYRQSPSPPETRLPRHRILSSLSVSPPYGGTRNSLYQHRSRPPPPARVILNLNWNCSRLAVATCERRRVHAAAGRAPSQSPRRAPCAHRSGRRGKGRHSRREWPRRVTRAPWTDTQRKGAPPRLFCSLLPAPSSVPGLVVDHDGRRGPRPAAIRSAA